MDGNSAQRLADGKQCLTAALHYLSLGWSALWLCPPDHIGVGRSHGKTCKSPGKAPFGLWAEFQTRLPETREIESRFTELPNGNVGMAYGPVSGLVGIDIDGPEGERMLTEKAKGDLPPTLEFKTPGGGRRLLYKIPPNSNLRTTYTTRGKDQEIRFQARGAQTVMPPSRHENGGQYEWVRGPDQFTAAPAPAWLLTELAPPTKGKSDWQQTDWDELTKGVGEGERNTSAAAWFGKHLDALRDVENNNAVAMVWRDGREWNERNDPPLPEEELKTVFASILQKEKAKRRAEDDEKFNSFVAAEVEKAATISAANGQNGQSNGHVNGQTNGQIPDWHLLIVKGDPAEYRLRATEWKDSPDLPNGYVTLKENDILEWRRIRDAVFRQSQIVVAPALKNWSTPGGHLDKLIKSSQIIVTVPERKRKLYMLGLFFRYIAAAKRAAEMPTNGRPTKMDDGTVLFKIHHLSHQLRFDKEDFKIQELIAVIEEMGVTQIKPRGKGRWWQVTPAVAEEIGIVIQEIAPAEKVIPEVDAK